MSKNRASKGVLLPPTNSETPDRIVRSDWLAKSKSQFVTTTPINKEYYFAILQKLWPEGHGLPGPHVTENEMRLEINLLREKQSKEPYKDVFRRMRELQGDEGFTCIVKEGRAYQLQSLQVRQKRTPRSKPSQKLWSAIKDKYDNRCAHCGLQEPSVKLSPDHKIPRSRDGGNSDENWQPLCESCNILKSSACQNCTMLCMTCPWAYPESYKQLRIDDHNMELIRRTAEKDKLDGSSVLNEILRRHFLRN